jgi:hypothetical protein
MDAIQNIVKNKLGLTGQQVWAYKEMYNFIGRFSFCQGEETNIWSKNTSLFDIKIEYKGEKKMIPMKVLEIIEKIGTDNLWMYFSPYAYEKKFESFCKKMFSEKAQMADYYTPGVIVIDRIVMHETEYAE